MQGGKGKRSDLVLVEWTKPVLVDRQRSGKLYYLARIIRIFLLLLLRCFLTIRETRGGEGWKSKESRRVNWKSVRDSALRAWNETKPWMMVVGPNGETRISFFFFFLAFRIMEEVRRREDRDEVEVETYKESISIDDRNRRWTFVDTISRCYTYVHVFDTCAIIASVHGFVICLTSRGQLQTADGLIRVSMIRGTPSFFQPIIRLDVDWDPPTKTTEKQLVYVLTEEES